MVLSAALFARLFLNHWAIETVAIALPSNISEYAPTEPWVTGTFREERASRRAI